MSRKLYIFDFDGTLSDTRHRRQLIDFDQNPIDWRPFSEACEDDLPIKSTVDTLNLLLRTSAEIWIWTSRNEYVRSQSVRWLHAYTDLEFGHNIYVRNFRMRHPTREGWADHMMKAEWLASMSRHDRMRLVAAFDDRPSMVKWWRLQGVACFDVGYLESFPAK